VRNNRGLSVIEIMVGIVLLATGILVTMGAISFGTKATYSSAQSTEASAFARRLMEIVLAGGPVRGPLVPGNTLNPAYDNVFRRVYDVTDGIMPPFELEDFLRSEDPKDLRRFVATAQNYEARVELKPFDDIVDPADFRCNLVNVTVELKWTDKTGPRSMKTVAVFKKG